MSNKAGDIAKLEEKLKQLQEGFENFKENMTSINEKKESLSMEHDGSMRQFCTSNETCSDIENSECKWMTCKCKPGLSYHHDTRKCLQDCGDNDYGRTYQLEIDTYLNGFATKTFTSVSVEDCVKMCSVNTDFLCRTAEYYKSGRTCCLSWETLQTNPKALKIDKDFILYTRDCKSQ